MAIKGRESVWPSHWAALPNAHPTMKGMGSKMKGLKMGFGKKKVTEDEPDKDKPDKTTGGIGSSAWRRRLEESAMQKLGLSKAEKDENTGDLDEELARFRATAADVAELLKRAEAYGNLTRSADEALLDLVACYDDAGAVDWGGSPPAGADDTKAVAEAVAGAKDRAVRGQLLKGWALGGLGSVLECARRIEDVAKHRHDLVMDYFARKRKLEAAEKAAGRAKDPHAKDRAAKGCEIPNFKGSYLGRFPLVSADFWTSGHLSERPRSVDAFSGTRARGTLTLKRR